MFDQVVKVLGGKKTHLEKTVAASLITLDSLLWPEVIYCVQARGNKLSSDLTLMFMHKYITLIHIGEKKWIKRYLRREAAPTVSKTFLAFFGGKKTLITCDGCTCNCFSC